MHDDWIVLKAYSAAFLCRFDLIHVSIFYPSVFSVYYFQIILTFSTSGFFCKKIITFLIFYVYLPYFWRKEKDFLKLFQIIWSGGLIHESIQTILYNFIIFIFTYKKTSYHLAGFFCTFKTTYMLTFPWDSLLPAILGQALTRLVTVSSMHYCTSTSALSTSSSSRGFTSFEWDISS